MAKGKTAKAGKLTTDPRGNYAAVEPNLKQPSIEIKNAITVKAPCQPTATVESGSSGACAGFSLHLVN